MKAWLYRELNAHAKAWPYYQGDRAKQRKSIRDSLQHCIDALTTSAAYVSIGKGENALHYYSAPLGGWSDKSSYPCRCKLSGFGSREARMYQRLGLPVIDMTEANYAKLAKVVCSGPMIAYGYEEPDTVPRADGTFHGLQYRPLREVARAYRDAGATVHNLDLD
jgi:hypothetical protein